MINPPRLHFDRSSKWILNKVAVVCFLLPFGGQVLAVSGEATVLASPLTETKAQPFREGEQVAFVGDSITHSGFYHDYVYLYYATRFPGRKVSFYNCGISGDTAAGALRRVNGDILRHKPTVATIMLGMNDVNRGLYDEGNSALDLPKKREAALQSHFDNMRKLVERLSSEQVRLIFMTPSLYDQTTKLERLNSPGVNDALVLCGENARKLAAEFKGQVIDFNEPMAGINKTLQQADPTATIIGADRIHPGEKGHLIMAYLFLKAQNAPQFVADMTIDAKGQTEVQFTEQEKALPFPVSLAAAPALKLVPFMKELNQERLRVTNLPEASFDLLIDGERVASFTATELSKGVNLAELSNTPQIKQAQDVAKLDAKRHEIAKRLRTIDYVEWKMGREIGDPTDFDWGAAVEKMNADPKVTGWPKDRVADYSKLKPQQAALLKEHAEAIEAIRNESRPKEHHFIVRMTGTK
ncbi:MAG: SGNH/GDSL hydrolase family protein [Verrucomicrobiota bacterium]